MISAGRLRFLATIKRSSVLGDLGLRNKAFATTVGTFRCDMQDAGGGEIMYAGGISESRNWTVSARWLALEDEGLLASDRLEIDGKVLNIISISNEFNRDRLGTIQCSEVI